MIIISKRIIHQFIRSVTRSKEPLLNWYIKTKENDWANLADVKKVFKATDYVGNDLYVFNIGGNKYRLIARIFFSVRTIYIRFIGTHAEYEKIKLTGL